MTAAGAVVCSRYLETLGSGSSLSGRKTMITGIGHLAFRIADLERSLHFYCDILGFEEAFRLDREGSPSPWIVYIQVAPGQYIELFPVGIPEGEAVKLGTGEPRYALTGGDIDASSGGSYHHFSLTVDDVQATLRELIERGVPTERVGTASEGPDHNRQYWIADPDGNRVELMEITSASPHAAAEARWAAKRQR
jgi:lactoylglutathione lyase